MNKVANGVFSYDFSSVVFFSFYAYFYMEKAISKPV